MIARRSFWFLRHGETEWNRAGRWQGSTDIPLSARGEEQARSAIPYLEPLAIEAIRASPLRRARRTADIVAEVLALPVVEVPGLEEFSIGPHEGGSGNHWLDAWRADEAVPGVESFPAFRRRVADAVNTALGQAGSVLIVAHGGVFWALERLCGRPSFSNLGHCQPARLTPEGATRWRIEIAGEDGD